jgi:glycosyltransferase involved in cell wall biosynthesis
MVVADRQGNDPDVLSVQARNNLTILLRRRIRQARNKRTLSRYSATRPVGYDMFSTDLRCLYGADLIPGLPPHDVINMHFVACFVHVNSFISAVPAHVPVFWKLDDMNAFTGGCHFDHDCGKHATGCGACPQLGSIDPGDLSNQVWKRKRAAYGRFSSDSLHIVALNAWMANKVRRSPLLNKFKVTVIPNGLDTDTFAPQGTHEARGILGIPQDARVVLFVAESIENKRKGFELLVDALAGLRGIERLFLLSVGDGSLPVKLDIPHLHLGYIDNDRQLSVAYSAADVFVITSLHDNQPNTVLEAMACGIPVVGFDIGGVSEMVRPESTGLLALAGDVPGLRASIAQLLECDSKRDSMKAECRRIVLQEYGLEMQTKRYVELYETELQRRRSSGQTRRREA